VKKIFQRITPALLFAVFLLPSSVQAQILDLTVSPVSLDFSPRPGEIIQDKVTIHNNSNTPLTLDLTVNTMTVDEQGNIVPAEIPNTSPVSNWISFSSSSITAPVKEWLDVPFTITVPLDAAFGNYFALVFSPPATQPEGGTAAVQGNILVPILLNVQKEGAVTQASITEFKIKNFVTQYLPTEFSVSVKNSGNVHLRPRGNVFIRGTGQKDLAVLEVNPGLGSILPGATRTYTTSWKDGFLVRSDEGKLTFNWNKLTDFRIGKYTAYVLLAYDDGQRDIPIDSTLTFWVFPYTAAIVILVSISLVIILISYVFKTLVRKEAKRLKN